MSLRFQRRIKIAKGVSLNVSKSGFGISAGPRGAKIGTGPRGAHYSVGIPGTGLAYRKEIRHKRPTGTSSRSPRTAAAGLVDVQVTLDDTGKVAFLDAHGTPLPPKLVKQIREDRAREIARFLDEQCQRLNGGIDEILNTHLETPSPQQRIRYQETPFTARKPMPPAPQQPGFLDRLLPSRRARIEEANAQAEAAFRAERDVWEAAKAEHETREAQRRRELEEGLLRDETVMERVLEERLASLAWPRETDLSYQLAHDGKIVGLDIDLPEVEDMPDTKAEVAASGFKVNIKSKSDTQVRKEYMQFVHAILFRAIGEAFYTLPAAEEIVASGYSQRPDPATGQVRDDYLLSVRVDRARWGEINFANLNAVDLISSVERFELVRKMTKTGVFKPIEPLPLDG